MHCDRAAFTPVFDRGANEDEEQIIEGRKRARNDNVESKYTAEILSPNLLIKSTKKCSGLTYKEWKLFVTENNSDNAITNCVTSHEALPKAKSGQIPYRSEMNVPEISIKQPQETFHYRFVTLQTGIFPKWGSASLERVFCRKKWLFLSIHQGKL